MERRMDDRNNTRQRFQDYRPSKAALFWACAGCVVATLIVGFTWGGWVTGATAREMAKTAAEKAQAQVVATVCVDKFMAAADARPQLASLKEDSSSWRRERFVKDGGWAMIDDQSYDGAAKLCADRLMAMDLPPAQEAATTETGSVTQ
jgi:hypothetical protein